MYHVTVSCLASQTSFVYATEADNAAHAVVLARQHGLAPGHKAADYTFHVSQR